MKKALALVLAIMMMATVLVGCGAEPAASDSQPASQAGSEPAAPADPSKPFAGQVVTYATTDTAAAGDEIIDLVKMVEEKTGIKIEFNIIPNAADGEVDKTLVSLQAGDPIDLIYGTTPGLKPFYNAGVLQNLEELAAEDNYDMEKIFGENLPRYNDGKVYGLPAFSDIWVTFYNKKFFDEKGVEYPSLEGWTWEKYIETAHKMHVDEMNWGSLMPAYDNCNYLYAIQKGAKPYKEDGTANFDDPLFAEGLKFFYDLGNVEKIQPNIIEMVAKVYPWNAYTSTGVANAEGVYEKPRFAMTVIGGWVASMLTNEDKYPRDWECGIAPMPYPDGEKPSSLTVTGCYAIPTTSTNKDAAFEVLKCIAENQYTLGYGRVPARKDLTDEEALAYINEALVPTYKALDNISAEEFKAGWFDPERTLYPEKILGTADGVINRIWTEEGQLYGQGQQTLEEAMAKIQERANKAIAEELASNA